MLWILYRSPRQTVTYSDRYIPSRAMASRLNFSLLEREEVASEPRAPVDREVCNALFSAVASSFLVQYGNLQPSHHTLVHSCSLELPVAMYFLLQESNQAYNLLLRTELLGVAPVGAPSPDNSHLPGDLLRSPARYKRRQLVCMPYFQVGYAHVLFFVLHRLYSCTGQHLRVVCKCTHSTLQHRMVTTFNNGLCAVPVGTSFALSLVIETVQLVVYSLTRLTVCPQLALITPRLHPCSAPSEFHAKYPARPSRYARCTFP